MTPLTRVELWRSKAGGSIHFEGTLPGEPHLSEYYEPVTAFIPAPGEVVVGLTEGEARALIKGRAVGWEENNLRIDARTKLRSALQPPEEESRG